MPPKVLGTLWANACNVKDVKPFYEVKNSRFEAEGK